MYALLKHSHFSFQNYLKSDNISNNFNMNFSELQRKIYEQKLSTSTFEDLSFYAQTKIISQQVSEAKIYVQMIMRKFPDKAVGYALWGDCLFFLGKAHQSIQYYSKAYSIQHRPQFVFGLAKAFTHVGRFQFSIRAYEIILKIDPNHIQARFNLALIYFQHRQFEKSLKLLQQLQILNPDEPKSLYQQALALCELERPDQAIQLLERIYAKFPNYIKLNIPLGMAYQMKGHGFQSINAYQRILAIEPKNIYALVNIAIAYRNCGQIQSSLEFFQKALAIQQNYEIYIQIAVNYGMQSNYIKSQQYCLKAIKYNPNSPNQIYAYLQLASIYQSQKKYTLSKQYLEKAASINPKESKIYNELGILQRSKGNYRQSIESSTKSLELNETKDNRSTAYLNIANSHYFLGQFNQAIIFYEKSLLFGQKCSSFIGLGLCYLSIKQFDKSITCYKNAMKIDPDHPHIYINLAIIFRCMEGKMLSDQKINIMIDEYLGDVRQNINMGLFLYQLSNNENRPKHFSRMIQSYFEQSIINRNSHGRLELLKHLKSIYEQKVKKTGIAYDFLFRSMLQKELKDIVESANYFQQLRDSMQFKQSKTYPQFISLFWQNLAKYLTRRSQQIVMGFMMQHMTVINLNQTAEAYQLMKYKIGNNFLNFKIESIIIGRLVNSFKPLCRLLQVLKRLLKQDYIIKYVNFTQAIKCNSQQAILNSQFIQALSQISSNNQSKHKCLHKNNLLNKIKLRLIGLKSNNSKDNINSKLFAFLFRATNINKYSLKYNRFFGILDQIQIQQQKLKAIIISILERNINLQLKADQIYDCYLPYLKLYYLWSDLLVFILQYVPQKILLNFTEITLIIYDNLKLILQQRSFEPFQIMLKKLYSIADQLNQGSIINSDLGVDSLSINNSMNDQFETQSQTHSKPKNRKRSLQILKDSNTKQNKQTQFVQLIRSYLGDLRKKGLLDNQQVIINSNIDSDSSLQIIEQYNDSSIAASISSKGVATNSINFEYYIFEYGLPDLPFYELIKQQIVLTSLLIQKHLKFIQHFSQLKPIRVATYKVLKVNHFKNQPQRIQSFKFGTAKGERQFSIKNKQTQSINDQRTLISFGRKAIYCWIISAARIIQQLQSLGIYQADFQIRNTIKFGEVFVGIDFDYAFQTRNGNGYQDQLFLITKKIINLWLHLYQDQRFAGQEAVQKIQSLQKILMSYLFKNAKQKIKQKIRNVKKKIVKPSQIINLQQKTQQCMRILQQHMRDHHFIQIYNIIVSILNNSDLQCLTNLEKANILESLKILQKNLDYAQFADTVNRLYITYYHENNPSYLLGEKIVGLNINGSICQSLTLIQIDRLRQLIKFQMIWMPEYIIRPLSYLDSSSNQIKIIVLNSYTEFNSLEQITQHGKEDTYYWMISIIYLLQELEHAGIYLKCLDATDMVKQGEKYKLKCLKNGIKINCNNQKQSLSYLSTRRLICHIAKLLIDKCTYLDRQGVQQIYDAQLRSYFGKISNHFIECFIEVISKQITLESKIDHILSDLTQQVSKVHFYHFQHLFKQLVPNQNQNCQRNIFEQNQLLELKRYVRLSVFQQFGWPYLIQKLKQIYIHYRKF